MLLDLPTSSAHDLAYEERVSKIVDHKSGKTISSLPVVVPSTWSLNASDILAQKYLRKAGVPSSCEAVSEAGVPESLQRRRATASATFGAEKDARQVFERLAGCWTYEGWKRGYFTSEEEALAYRARMRHLIERQMGAPNSPQFFNTGLYWAYGIEGLAQGQYFIADDGEITAATNAYEHPVVHACFILGLEDNLVGKGGIFDRLLVEARIFKFGSGSGMNLSKLRAAHEPLSGGGTSSGVLSFMRPFDASAGSTKSAGLTRRAAKMVLLDADHPEILDFATLKVREEEKVAMLVAGSITLEAKLRSILSAIAKSALPAPGKFESETNGELRAAVTAARNAGVPEGSIEQFIALAREGFTDLEVQRLSADWNGEAYATVTAQNANNSIRFKDEFFAALATDGDWKLVRRTDGGTAKTIKAKDLWRTIALSTWRCGDPGMQFHTTINAWHTCPEDGEILSSNPCSEYVFLDNTACNLASLNLVKYLDEKCCFDFEAFANDVKLWTKTLDISIAMSGLPDEDVARGTRDYRTIGLGFANLGALLMRLGLAYDSDAGRAMAAAITAILHASASLGSAELARDLGAFPRFNVNRYHVLRVLRNHHKAAQGATIGYEGLNRAPVTYAPTRETRPLLAYADDLFVQAYAAAERYGMRNAQTTLLAPAGTIGLLMDCDTTGVEPDFALVKYKTLAGGGAMKIVNASVRPALKRLGYDEQQISDIETYAKGTLAFDPADRRELEKHVSPGDVVAMEAFLGSALTIEMAAGIAGVDVNAVPAQSLERISAKVCGTMTLEGAPHLEDVHLAVFDCAQSGGFGRARAISAHGHVDMVAAVQPFLSGAVSKTVNMPKAATVADIEAIYLRAWEKGVKAIAVYRDGSKLTQVLSGGAQPKSTALEVAKQIVAGQRRKMPSRRNGYTQEIEIGGLKVYLKTGEFEDGALGEIFLDINKEGTVVRALMNCFAIAVSMGLQWGVPVDVFVDKFSFTRFEPSGPVQNHDRIKMANSLIDAIFRDIGINYLCRDDLAHLPATVPVSSVQPAVVRKPAVLGEREQAIAKGFSGDPCHSCGLATMVRNGTCERCTSCGATSGCS